MGNYPGFFTVDGVVINLTKVVSIIEYEGKVTVQSDSRVIFTSDTEEAKEFYEFIKMLSSKKSNNWDGKI